MRRVIYSCAQVRRLADAPSKKNRSPFVKCAPSLLISPLRSVTIALSLIFARRFLFAAAQTNLKPALPRAFSSLVRYPSQLLAGILDVRLCFVAARRRAPMPSLRCRHTASSSAPPLRLSKMQDTPPAPRFYALLRNYRSVAHFRSAVSFRGSTDKLKARVAAGFFFFSVILHNYLRGFLMFACAAARRAIGTRKGEQDT